MTILSINLYNRKRGYGMEYVVRTNLLTKKIHDYEIVSNVSITIKKGEIYGLLGPNGRLIEEN